MQHKIKILRLIMAVAIASILVIIYLLSSQPAPESSRLSTSLATYTHSLYEKITNSEITLKAWDHKLRKLAHAFVFFVLASFIMLQCYIFNVSYKKTVVITLLCSVSFAAADEFHQLFVNGRGASIGDVGIDSIGIIIAIALLSILFRRNR